MDVKKPVIFINIIIIKRCSMMTDYQYSGLRILPQLLPNSIFAHRSFSHSFMKWQQRSMPKDEKKMSIGKSSYTVRESNPDIFSKALLNVHDLSLRSAITLSNQTI